MLDITIIPDKQILKLWYIVQHFIYTLTFKEFSINLLIYITPHPKEISNNHMIISYVWVEPTHFLCQHTANLIPIFSNTFFGESLVPKGTFLGVCVWINFNLRSVWFYFNIFKDTNPLIRVDSSSLVHIWSIMEMSILKIILKFWKRYVIGFNSVINLIK